jgi:hypothetical protein
MILNILSEVTVGSRKGKKGRSHMCYINVIRASQIFQKPSNNLKILGARRVT